MRVGLFGAGAYGMALSSILVHNRHEVTMWTKSEEEAERLRKTSENSTRIKDFKIDKEVKITTNVEECIKKQDILIIAIPAAFVDELCIAMQPFVKKEDHIIIATKGIEQGTGLFMDEIVRKHLDTKNIAVISGPSFAVDIVTKKPVGTRMGGGKSSVEEWIAPVKKGTIIVEIDNVSEDVARNAMQKAMCKMPVSCIIVKRKFAYL